MTNLVGKFFLDTLEDWRGGYIREVLATDESGDDHYRVSVPNQSVYEVVHGDFIRECLEIAGER